VGDDVIIVVEAGNKSSFGGGWSIFEVQWDRDEFWEVGIIDTRDSTIIRLGDNTEIWSDGFKFGHGVG